MEIPLKTFKRAREEIQRVLNVTPMHYSRTFSEMARCQVYLKPECLQKTGSFKVRGAYNLLRSLPEDKKGCGVVTFSGGNWAQGVAYGANLLDINALIVMPETVPMTKLKATRAYGADVLLYGRTSVELCEKAKALSKSNGKTFISALDEPNMIIGHGSIGLEITDELPDVDVILVPVGGGGLISSIAMTVKQVNPRILVYGVQPKGAAAMYASLKSNSVIELEKVETIAEGLALKRSGEMTFGIIRNLVEDIILVSDEELKKAVLMLLERGKLLVEPSGAAPLAALLSGRVKFLRKDAKVVLVLSGGNIDLPVLGNLVRSQ